MAPHRQMLMAAATAGAATQVSAMVQQQSAQNSPLSSVIQLLGELEAKVQAQGESEAKTYAEYKEWCDDTLTNTKFDIKTASTQQEKLEAKIAELGGSIESSASKIDGLASGIASATGDLKSATAIRSKEESDFSTSEKELLEVVDTLGRAISILEREMQKSPAAFAQMTKGGLSSVLSSLSTVTDAAAFSAADQHRLMALVQSSDEDKDGTDDMGAPAAAVYDSHSSSIFDVLEDMKEKAEEQLASLRKAEVNAKHNFNMLKQSLDGQLAADNKDLAAEKAAKNAASEGKATAEGDLEETVADLKSSKGALATATSTCAQVTSDHEASVKARDEELKVIAEATQVLKQTTSGAASQTYSLLQLASGSGIRTHADLARSEVLTLVKRLAREHHSSALAQLASRIAAVVSASSRSGAQPFAKVKGLISDLIAKLESEASAEATEKSFCDEEIAKTAAKKDELDVEASKLATKIDQATARSGELKGEVSELQNALANVAKEQVEANKIRKQTHEDYVQAKADLEQGVAGVRKALVVLRDYYAAKDGEASLLQSGESQPEMPETHSASSGSGTNIIGILEVVESDFATNLAKEETAEATAQEEFEKMTQENKITTASKEQDVKYKNKEITSLDKSVAEMNSDLGTTNAELAAVMEYDGKIKGRCIAKPEAYAQRAERRKAEISGLKEALHILTEDTALLQHKSRGHHVRGALKVHA